MNKYLLLRDNKQSGPYSVKELSAHGLKPYDLVWLEGKSAAWRYPSEIDELKPFAPVVEEQPFDRFYKKPEIKTTEPAVRDNTRVAASNFLQHDIKKAEDTSPTKQHVDLSNNAKKIHISLPATNAFNASASSASQNKSGNTATQVTPQIESEKTVSQPLSNEESSSYALNKKTFSTIDAQQNLEKLYTTIKQKHSVDTPGPGTAKEAPVSKLLFRTVAAACLLLGGALIGLIVNYNSQQKKFQQLNQLVQEIRHQENPGTPKTMKNDVLAEESKIAKADSGKPPEESEAPVYKEDIELPPVKKNPGDSKKKRVTDTVSRVQITPEVVPAVLKTEEPVTKIDKVASELAKKNLWQLVSVDHNKYKTGVFGGISNLSLKLSNKSLVQLQQVEVEVLYLSPEKKTVNKQKIVFENVAPGEQLALDVPKSSRGVKIEYSIKKITTKEFELAHAGM